MISTAIMSRDGRYRFQLDRLWSMQGPVLGFWMLNPSTADAKTDDPTIRSCIRIAKALGYGGLTVVNLFAYRCTNPDDLAVAAAIKNSTDYVTGGERNASCCRLALTACEKVVLGWGTRGGLFGQDKLAFKLFGTVGRLPYYLHRTADGYPGHPLYLPTAVKPMIWGRVRITRPDDQ